ncbi:hypothetical protein D3C80_2018760 [compost metagenome]
MNFPDISEMANNETHEPHETEIHQISKHRIFGVECVQRMYIQRERRCHTKRRNVTGGLTQLGGGGKYIK